MTDLHVVDATPEHAAEIVSVIQLRLIPIELLQAWVVSGRYRPCNDRP